MTQYKECSVVLLPTKDLSALWSYKGRRLYYNAANFNDPDETIYYHLYIISEDLLGTLDWFVDFELITGSPLGIHKYGDFYNDNKAKKIIATTDEKLIKEGIASIDDEFIKQYCDTPVNKVLVEYIKEKYHDRFKYYNEDSWGNRYNPKLLSNGSIIIRSKEISLRDKLYVALYAGYSNGSLSSHNFKEFVEEWLNINTEK